MESYDESKDYKQIHLEWIKANRSFRPKRGISPQFSNYFDEMVYTYGPEGIKFNKTAYIYLRDDFFFSQKSKTINDEVASMFGCKIVNSNPSFFVTFNWTDENFKFDKIHKSMLKLFSKSWIDNAKAVFEYNTTKGNHPHAHMVIQVNKHKTFGRFKDKILQSCMASTLAKNFIDIKLAQSYHQDYLDGDKRQEKMPLVEADKIWRQSLGIKEEYTKNE